MILTRSTVILRAGLFLSSMIGGASLAGPAPSSCAVVGAGVLGTSLCRQILQDPSMAHVVKVTGITKTSNRHEGIRNEVLHDLPTDNGQHSDRFELKIYDDLTSNDKFDNVVFCAPPSGFEDYATAVEDAASRVWAGPSAGGVFIFTSSGAVYPQETGAVTASSPINEDLSNPRTLRLVKAEQASFSVGGACLRLAGLYNLQRGPHNFWLISGKPIAGSPDGLVNMLHYDDAAGACLAAIKAGADKISGKAFLVSDSHPMTRLQLCESSLKAAVYREMTIPPFTTESTGTHIGKTYDCTDTYEILNWKPKYESFDSFMSANA